ncbi:hypothetical protein MPLDJ20_220042 [Mesorhizobium plurifarium]|uniref:Uncharacterized protein n=1 Tax=Mesorhizobium plurifarium TaxID=69974 RepID=A0A090GM01_MESPL|nr:hypothetical protein MPLDJ20_220042 [Mesorhizobium plurifarium]
MQQKAVTGAIQASPTSGAQRALGQPEILSERSRHRYGNPMTITTECARGYSGTEIKAVARLLAGVLRGRC